MSRLVEELQAELAALERDGLTRRCRTLDVPCGPLARIAGRELVSFCSNDYLGLAGDPALAEAAAEGARRWGVGSGASHLVSGHFSPHQQLEERLAAFTGFARALLFSTGYMANLGIVPALVGRGDAVFADRLNHASLIDAVQLSRADHQRYPHGDLDTLERQLAASEAKRKLILTDAVFSMDGDVAPLAALLELAERHDAWLVIDDAHGFGVLGPQGRGAVAEFIPGFGAYPERLVYMGTLGKAAGASGAFVAGSRTVVEWLLQRARTYIFTTGSSPLIACALLASLDRIEHGDARRERLQALTAQLAAGLAGSRWKLVPSPTAIQPVIIGDNHEAVRVASALFDHGLWVPAIRPPTVPKGTARLRVSLSAAHAPEHVARLVDALLALA